MDFTKLHLDDSRLNWGVVKLRIVEELWKKRSITGRGIRIGILDSGSIPDHKDLPIFPKSQMDFTGSQTGNGDVNSHGTWCGGVAVASGSEVFGVAPESNMAYGRISLTSKSVAEGIEWLLEVRPSVQIISISLELFKSNDSEANFNHLRKAIENAEEKGKIVVASVGNSFSRRREMTKRYPAAFPTVLAIGAVKSDLMLHEESGMNNCVDLLAPGEELLTAEQGGGIFPSFRRTSAAAAFAGGALALVLQFLKDQNIDKSPSEIRELMRETAAFNFPDAQKCQSNLYGCGIIDPIAAINKIGLTA